MSSSKRDSSGHSSAASQKPDESPFQAINRSLKKEVHLRKTYEKYIPPKIRDRLADNPDCDPFWGERRHVTIAFCDISGFTTLSEKLEPDLIVEVLNVVFETICEEVENYGGTVDKFLGDAAMVTFGTASTREDEPVRALQFARTVMQRVSNLTFPEVRLGDKPLKLKMSIGMHTGLVVAGNIGTLTRMEYTVIGDSVNIASRLQSLAKPGSILVSEQTRKFAPADDKFKSLGNVVVKGRRKPVKVFQFQFKRRQHKQQVIGSAIPFCGRESELNTISEALASIEAGTGKMVLISGQSGIGKTRLIEEWLRCRAGPYNVLWIAPHYENRNNPMDAVIRELGHIFKINRQFDSRNLTRRIRAIARWFHVPPNEWYDLVESITWLFQEEGSSGKKRESSSEEVFSLFNGVLLLIKHSARNRPILLVIDNYQWLDSASRQCLEYIARQVSGCRVGIVLSGTKIESNHFPKNAVTITLSGLDQANAAKLLDAILGTDSLPATAKEQIALKARENPLMIALFAKCHQFSCSMNSIDQSSLPADLQALVQLRKDHLSHSTRAMLEIASVYGDRIDVEMLCRLHKTQEKDVENSLKEMVNGGFVFFNPEMKDYEFTHSVIREAIYQSILIRNRRVFHDQISSVIENRMAGMDHPEAIIAHHILNGSQPVKALHYLERAAQHFQRYFQYDSALEMYKNGLLILEGEGDHYTMDHWKFLFRSGQLSSIKGNFELSISFFKSALVFAERSGDQMIVAETLVKLGDLFAGAGNLEVAMVYLEKACGAFSRTADAEGEVKALNSLAIMYLQTGDLKSAGNVINKCVRAAEKSDNRDLTGITYSNLGIYESMRGEYSSAISGFIESIRHFESTGRLEGIAQALHNIGMTYEKTGDWDLAEEYYERSLEISRETGDKEMVAKTMLNRSQIAYLQGDLLRAKALNSQAVSMLKTINSPIMLADAYLTLGQIYNKENNRRTAKGLFAAALRINRRLRHVMGQANSAYEYGCLLRLENKRVRSKKILKEAIRAFEQLGDSEKADDVRKRFDISIE
ncbi:tetratricopeptide repeat protein [bacterium]|nr:tetratricopeptide repeat protein [candidate division CSSED10-310 bacterium]